MMETKSRRNPVVSVIVPVYRSEKYLPQCIESILNQSLADIELILVNDGSPDRSGDVCDSYASKDERVKVIHQENRGGSFAFQSGYNAARGKYILRVDGDDWIDAETCSVSVATAEQHEADVVFWSRIKEAPEGSTKESPIFDQTTVFEKEKMEWLKRRVVGLLGKELAKPMQTDALSSVWGKLYRREIIVGNQITSADKKGNLNFDVFFTIRAFQHVSKAVYLHKFLSHYRLGNPNSITRNHGFNLINRYKNMFAAIEDHLHSVSASKEFFQAFQNRIALSVVNNAMSITGPYNNSDVKTKIEHLKLILNLDRYKEAFKRMELKYLPFHWKTFFFLCRIRSATAVYYASLAMRRFR